MSSKQNPFRTRFTKAPADLQIKILRKALTASTDLKQLVNQLFSVDPYISERQDGRVSLLTDKHLFPCK